jgi:hypothetical protein
MDKIDMTVLEGPRTDIEGIEVTRKTWVSPSGTVQRS